MYGRIIIREIVRHSLDLFLDFRCICSFFEDNETLPRVFLPCRKVRIFAISDSLKRCIYRDRILLRIFDSLDPADGIGMPLAHALSPECIVFPVRKDGVCIQPVEREHSRIPAHRNNADLTCFFRSRVYIRIMLRNLCVGVKTVNNIEHTRILRCLFRKIRGTAATKDQHINFIFPFSGFICSAYRYSVCQYCYIGRISPGKYCSKLHVRILFYGTLNPTSKISIA